MSWQNHTLRLLDKYSDLSIKNIDILPNRQYIANTADYDTLSFFITQKWIPYFFQNFLKLWIFFWAYFEKNKDFFFFQMQG